MCKSATRFVLVVSAAMALGCGDGSRERSFPAADGERPAAGGAAAGGAGENVVAGGGASAPAPFAGGISGAASGAGAGGAAGAAAAGTEGAAGAAGAAAGGEGGASGEGGGAQASTSARAMSELDAYLSAEPAQRGELADQPFATVPLTSADATEAAARLWADHAQQVRAARGGEVGATEQQASTVQIGEHRLRYYMAERGDEPAGGRSLFISMHGGGSAPAATNDSQCGRTRSISSPATIRSTRCGSRRARPATTGTCGSRRRSKRCSSA